MASAGSTEDGMIATTLAMMKKTAEVVGRVGQQQQVTRGVVVSELIRRQLKRRQQNKQEWRRQPGRTIHPSARVSDRSGRETDQRVWIGAKGKEAMTEAGTVKTSDESSQVRAWASQAKLVKTIIHLPNGLCRRIGAAPPKRRCRLPIQVHPVSTRSVISITGSPGVWFVRAIIVAARSGQEAGDRQPGQPRPQVQSTTHGVILTHAGTAIGAASTRIRRSWCGLPNLKGQSITR